jgi:hypothetical protein
MPGTDFVIDLRNLLASNAFAIIYSIMCEKGRAFLPSKLVK